MTCRYNCLVVALILVCAPFVQPPAARAQVTVAGLGGACDTTWECNSEYAFHSVQNDKNSYRDEVTLCYLIWDISGFWRMQHGTTVCSTSTTNCEDDPPPTGYWTNQGYGFPTVTGSVCSNPDNLPVELTRFEALSDDASVSLLWSTASETDNAGFSVEQEIGTEAFREIGYVEGHGTTVEPKEYSFAVNDLDPGLHRFRLKQIDLDGAFEYSSIVEAAVTVPDRFLIEPAYPNPFNPSTTLRFAVATEQHVEVTLVNTAGQSVQSLYSGTVAANEMQQLTVIADALPSGTYLVRFEGNGLSATERIVLAK